MSAHQSELVLVSSRSRAEAMLTRGFRRDKPVRSLFNAEKVRQELAMASQNQTQCYVNPVTYFESASSFVDQEVDFYSSVDIVLSLHGAQLTVIAVMPPCSFVMDLFQVAHQIKLASVFLHSHVRGRRTKRQSSSMRTL